MDLTELKSPDYPRHPWEISRLAGIMTLIKSMRPSGCFLDIGCGDGFIAREVSVRYPDSHIDAVDINLNESLIRNLKDNAGRISYMRDIPPDKRYKLIMLFDVIEHVENDAAFLSGLASQKLESGGKMLITVPAFNSLFSIHDIYLKHFRRYSREGLIECTSSAGLDIERSGYFFFSLLLPKLLIYKLFPNRNSDLGVGSWGGGKLLSLILSVYMKIENSSMITLARAGICIPGLSVWAICRKR